MRIGEIAHMDEVADARAIGRRIVGAEQGEGRAETGRIAGKPVPHAVGPRRPGDSPKLVGDIAKARRELGWEPQRDLAAQIEDTLRWRRKMPRSR